MLFNTKLFNDAPMSVIRKLYDMALTKCASTDNKYRFK